MYSKTKMKQRVLLVGADGHDLLNRISTLQISRLPEGQRTLGLILNPQGKIRATFWITKKNATESELEFVPPFLEILDQFTFAEKYEIKPLTLGQEAAATEVDRIRHLTPRLGSEYRHDGTTNPLEVNLRSQIHDGKGCYPGQEVIEKIISLGSPPRKLVLLESSIQTIGDAALPLPLLDPQSLQEVGRLTSFEKGLALGIVRRTHLKEGQQLVVPQKIEFIVKRISE